MAQKIIFKRTPFDIPIALFLISQILSTIFSLDPHVSFWGYYSRFNGGLLSTISYIFLYYAFVSNFFSEDSHSDDESTESSSINKLYVGLALGSILFWAMLVSVTGGMSFLQSLFLLLTFLSPCVLLIKAYNILPLKKLFAIMLSSGGIVAIWGFTSHFGYDFTCLLFRGTLNVSCWTDAFQPTVRLFSTLGQPNWLAAYFAVLIPLSLAFGIYTWTSPNEDSGNSTGSKFSRFFHSKKDILASLYMLLATLFFVEILWTQSLSGYIGLICGLVVFLSGMIFIAIKKRRIGLILKNIPVKITVLLLAVFLLCSFILGNPLQGRFPSLSLNGIMKSSAPPMVSKTPTPPVAQELGGSDSGKIRLVVWRGAIELFKKHPILGTGVETFAYSYYTVRPQEHNLLSEWDFLYNKAHNEYLNYLATTGIVGLGTYILMIVWFIAYTIRFLIKKSNTTDMKTLLVLALLSAYITILVSNFFGFSVVIMNLFLFFIPALAYCIIHPPKASQEAFTLTPVKSLGVIVVGIVCLFLELQLLNYWLADQSYSMGYNLNRVREYVQANKYLEDAANLYPGEDLYKNELSLNLATLALLLSQQKQPTQAALFLSRSKNMSDEVMARHPYNVVFYKTRVQTLFELSEIEPKYYKVAIAAIKKARTLAPTDAKLAYNEGLLYGQKGDLPNAIQALSESVALKPNYKEPRYGMAVWLSQQAKEETDPQKKQELLNAAKEQLSYVLTHIAPQDKQSAELLKSLE